MLCLNYVAFNMETVKRKPNWSEKETLMLVRGERPRGSSLCKICGGWDQGDKIKRDRLGEVASMINRFVFAHPNIYIEITPLKENKQNVSILNKRPCTDK